MSETRTTEEVKQGYLAAMGPALGLVYYALYHEFVWLHVRWRQYAQLFGATPARVDLLNQTAGLFVWSKTVSGRTHSYICRE